MLSSAVLISRKPMRSLVYVYHMTCGITKYACGLALHRLSDRIFTYTWPAYMYMYKLVRTYKKTCNSHQTLFPRRGVGSGDETTFLFGNDRYMVMVVIALLTVHVPYVQVHVQVNKHTMGLSPHQPRICFGENTNCFLECMHSA